MLSGKVVVGRWTRLAVERDQHDREHGSERGLYFDEERAAHVCEFFERYLRHSLGEWAGQPFVLEDWQVWWLWTLFGWMRKDGTRRFRQAYQEMARKGGKSSIAAGVGLYLMAADGEVGARVYSAATKRDQALLVFKEAKRMVMQSPQLLQVLAVNVCSLHSQGLNASYEPLSADANTMDGLNISGAIIDELHKHRTRDVYDVLTTATGARREPLIFSITTAGAGTDKHTVCHELHEYGCKILEGILADDAFFVLIYAIDEGDDWKDERCWIKANPNLGVSVKIQDLREKAARAKRLPAQQNSFRRLHLDVWTEQDTRWIDMDEWRACDQGPVSEDEIDGRRCFVGLDLANTRDIAAAVFLLEPRQEGRPWDVLCRFYCPADRIAERAELDRVPYPLWRDQGLLVATPGNVIDHEFIVADILEMKSRVEIVELAFDRWGSQMVVNALVAGGFSVDADERSRGGAPLLVQFGQGYASMGPATKALEEWILAKRISHGGHPILAWMASNVVVRMDPAGNLKPDKAKSAEKIDGMVALIMAIDRASRDNREEMRSVYETRGFLWLDLG